MYVVSLCEHQSIADIEDLTILIHKIWKDLNIRQHHFSCFLFLINISNNKLILLYTFFVYILFTFCFNLQYSTE